MRRREEDLRVGSCVVGSPSSPGASVLTLHASSARCSAETSRAAGFQYRTVVLGFVVPGSDYADVNSMCSLSWADLLQRCPSRSLRGTALVFLCVRYGALARRRNWLHFRGRSASDEGSERDHSDSDESSLVIESRRSPRFRGRRGPQTMPHENCLAAPWVEPPF